MNENTQHAPEEEDWDWRLLIPYAFIVFMLVNTLGVVIGDLYF
jgi:hypothetical protein